MTIYVVILVISLLFAIADFGFKKAHSFTLMTLYFLVIAVIFSFRGDIGADYYAYEAVFKFIKPINEAFYSTAEGVSLGVEPLYFILTSIVKVFTDNFNIFLGIISLLIFGFLTVSVLKLNVPPLIFSFFYFTNYLLESHLVQVRMGIIYAICFLALYYAFKRMPLFFFTTVAIATLFQTTALALVPIYFITKLRITFIRFMLLVTGSFILSYSDLTTWIVLQVARFGIGGGPIYKFVEYYKMALVDAPNVMNGLVGISLQIISICLLIWCREKLKMSPLFHMMLNVQIAGLILYIILYQHVYLSDRILKIYMTSSLVNFSLVAQYLFKNRKRDIIYYVPLVFWGALSIYRYYSTIISTSSGINPFKFIGF